MKHLQFKHPVRNSNSNSNSMGCEESEESGRELHEQQKKLLLDNVRNVDTKLGRMQRKRGKREGENRRFDLLLVFEHVPALLCMPSSI